VKQCKRRGTSGESCSRGDSAVNYPIEVIQAKNLTTSNMSRINRPNRLAIIKIMLIILILPLFNSDILCSYTLPIFIFKALIFNI
jgi:hypothetical protein